MKSKRLNMIATFIDKTDKVADIGCDHAYLSIFLTENNLCQKVIATDINKNALKIAQNNIKSKHLEQKISTYLSDGLLNVSDYEINTLVLSGMGSHTILNIIDHIEKFPIKKLVIQSNNDLKKLRINLRKKGFYLQQEKVVYEKKHYYVIGLYTKKYTSLKLREKNFGKYDINNKDYYNYLALELDNITKKLKNSKNTKEKIKILIKKKLLRKYL